MKEIISQHVWLPERGITVLLPDHATRNLAAIQCNNQTLSSVEGERLRILSRNSTLRNRYPDAKIGSSFMQTVDYKKCEELLTLANDLSSHVLREWQSIQPQKPVAILLFGSVARGLVMPNTAPYASNIDIEVLGNISDADKATLLTAIRPHRERCQLATLSDRLDIDPRTSRQGYPFVQVQDTSKVKNGAYAEALELIGSCAFPLYDPENLWESIEEEALTFSYQNNERRRKSHKYKSLGVIYQR